MTDYHCDTHNPTRTHIHTRARAYTHSQILTLTDIRPHRGMHVGMQT